MPFQAVPNVAQTRIEGLVDNQLTINDLYFEISGTGITPTSLATLVGAVNTWASGTLAGPLSSDWSYTRVVGVDLGSQTGPEAVATNPTPGGVSGEAAPNNVAACISFRTNSRGRSFRGRNFVPGLPNGEITLNTMSSTLMDALLSAYSGLIGAGTFLAGWQWGVVSRISGGEPRTVGLFTPITSVAFTTNTVRSMRTREVGKGV
jgi:hypothetical protein